MSLAKWSAFEASAGLWYRRAALRETVVLLASMAMTTRRTTNAYHVGSTCGSAEPTSTARARYEM